MENGYLVTGFLDKRCFMNYLTLNIFYLHTYRYENASSETKTHLYPL